MPPTEYWKRQCWATYQTDPVGLKLTEELGADKIMWGSDFPHPDGIWPDSREYIARETAHLPADVRRKIVCASTTSRAHNLCPLTISALASRLRRSARTAALSPERGEGCRS
jgi:predicted TIM-barrel fold metal-dependent hydrolase